MRRVALAAVLALSAPVAETAVAEGALEQAVGTEDRDDDGRLDRTEAPVYVLSTFDEIDEDGDGYIDGFEAYRWDAKQLTGESVEPLARPSATPSGRLASPGPAGAEVSSVKELIERLDRDGDDRVSREELPPGQRYALEHLDLDKDGYIDLVDAAKLDRELRERQASAPQRDPSSGDEPHGRTLARVVQLMDTNGDGILQKREAPLRIQRVFERFDHNGDGAIDMSEAVQPPKPAPGSSGS